MLQEESRLVIDKSHFPVEIITDDGIVRLGCVICKVSVRIRAQPLGCEVASLRYWDVRRRVVEQADARREWNSQVVAPFVFKIRYGVLAAAPSYVHPELDVALALQLPGQSV